MLNLFITSTEKNSNKNFITAGLAITMQSLGYSVFVYKPVQMDCKCDENNKLQSEMFDYITKSAPSIMVHDSYRFGIHPNPLVASAKENCLISRDKIIADYSLLATVCECTIIDGLDGLGTPLNVDYLEENVIKEFDSPVLFVISPEKTPMNNIIMAINHAVSAGIKVRGVILNDYPDNTTDENIKLLPRFIEEYTPAKIIGILPPINPDIKPVELIATILTSIDIEAAFDMKIEKLEK